MTPILEVNIPFARPAWMAAAACRGSNQALFFPNIGESAADAHRICSTCPVRQPCLDYALDNHEHAGIWGGLSDRQRRDEARNRRKRGH